VADYQRVDLATLEVIRPRSVGAEHVALAAAQRLGLEAKLAALGFQSAPGSGGHGADRRAYGLPRQRVGYPPMAATAQRPGELLGYDFGTLDLNACIG